MVKNSDGITFEQLSHSHVETDPQAHIPLADLPTGSKGGYWNEMFFYEEEIKEVKLLDTEAFLANPFGTGASQVSIRPTDQEKASFLADLAKVTERQDSMKWWYNLFKHWENHHKQKNSWDHTNVLGGMSTNYINGKILAKVKSYHKNALLKELMEQKTIYVLQKEETQQPGKAYVIKLEYIKNGDKFLNELKNQGYSVMQPPPGRGWLATLGIAGIVSLLVSLLAYIVYNLEWFSKKVGITKSPRIDSKIAGGIALACLGACIACTIAR
eukprot:534860_1